MKRALSPGVLFRGPVPGRIGSGNAGEALAAVLGLAARDVPLQLAPFGAGDANLFPPAMRDAIETLKSQRVDPERSVVCQFLPAHELSLDLYGRFRLGRMMWGADKLPCGWPEICGMLDEVWVPNEFNREVFAASGVDSRKLRVVPPGVDTRRFHPELEPLSIPHKRSFNFLWVGEWSQRKGPDLLLRAFLAEFKAEEDVALILKTAPPPDSRVEVLSQLIALVEREAGLPLEQAPAVIVVQEQLDYQEMPRLYCAADAFVLPSRAEAYGRTCMEALAAGLPVIAGNWSGRFSYLHEQNGYPVDCKVVPAPAQVDSELYAGQCWAEPDVEQLRHRMRHVFTHRDEANEKALQGRSDMVTRWDWEVVLPRWVEEFERLLA
jgi:glycosyltransferase involved in cell wall biosynthesis